MSLQNFIGSGRNSANPLIDDRWIAHSAIEGFHETSYQANFASHSTRDRHVGFPLHGRG